MSIAIVISFLMCDCHATVLDDMILNMDLGVREFKYTTETADTHDAMKELRDKTKYEALRSDGEYYVLDAEFLGERDGKYTYNVRAGHGYALYKNDYYKKQYDSIKETKKRLKKVDGTRYEKVYKIYSYITKNIKYGKNYDSYSAFTEKKALCEGQAALFYRLCKMSKVPCHMVYGKVNGKRHAWNAVKLDRWYYVDTTNKYFLRGSDFLCEYKPEIRYKISKNDYEEECT